MTINEIRARLVESPQYRWTNGETCIQVSIEDPSSPERERIECRIMSRDWDVADGTVRCYDSIGREYITTPDAVVASSFEKYYRQSCRMSEEIGVLCGFLSSDFSN